MLGEKMCLLSHLGWINDEEEEEEQDAGRNMDLCKNRPVDSNDRNSGSA